MSMTQQAQLDRACEKYMNIQLQFNFNKILIFNISILKQTTFKIVLFFCKFWFSVKAFCYLTIAK